MDQVVALLGKDIEMARQDVKGMLQFVFEIIDHGVAASPVIEAPPIFDAQGN